jgi:hypothetical protein
MLDKPYKIFGRTDPSSLVSQARRVMSQIPMSEFSNASGKFFGNYQSWHFYKDSSLPLIKFFIDLCEMYRGDFEDYFEKKMEVNFINLVYTKDSSQQICIRHKDGYFFDGQIHLTILGNSNVVVEHNGLETLLHHPNGTFWYLNGSEYYHWIKSSIGERIEMLAPVNQRPEDLEKKLICVSERPERYLDTTSEQWKSLRQQQIEHVKIAIREKRASNLEVAAFNSYYDRQVEFYNKAQDQD